MRIAILQPSYLPWLGYLDQIARVDTFVLYDDVQYDKGGWRNRNRIRTSGEPGWSWLTLPVILPVHPMNLGDVRIDPRVPWGRKHLAAVRHAYAHAAHRDQLDKHLAGFFESSAERLVDVAIDSIRCLMKAIGVTRTLLRSSELGIAGDRNERLVRICRELGADEYVSGAAARAYLDVGLFEHSGIHVEWQDYQHPTYTQCFAPFVSHLSALDALLCVGSDATRSFLQGGRDANANAASRA